MLGWKMEDGGWMSDDGCFFLRQERQAFFNHTQVDGRKGTAFS